MWQIVFTSSKASKITVRYPASFGSKNKHWKLYGVAPLAAPRMGQTLLMLEPLKFYQQQQKFSQNNSREHLKNTKYIYCMMKLGSF